MATLDPNIILGAKPIQVENPMNQLAKLLQVQDMQQQGQMRNMQMQDAQSAREQSNRLAELYQSSMGADGKIDRNKLYQGAAQRGLGAKIPGLQKQFADADEQTGKVDAANFKLANERYGAFKTTLGALSQRQDLSKELVMQAGQELVSAGIIPAAMYQQSLANMPDDPVALRARLRDGLAAQMAPEKIFEVFAPKAEKIDNGQSIGFRDMNPNSPTYGQNTGGAAVQKQMTPGEMASNQIARGNLAVSQSRLAFDQGNAVSDAGGPSQAGLTKRYGKAPPGYRWKDDGTAEAIPGGPADIKSGEAGAKAQGRKDAAALAANNVLSAVTDAKELVGYSTSGLGAGFANIPGSPARDLQAKLDTVKANLGFDRLQQMREMSPTGGALGAVAVQELIALQSTVASLDQKQSPSELKKSLEKIEKHYNKWLETVNGDAAPTVNNPMPASPQDQQAMEWANANPNDPRAKQILQRLGGR